MHTKRSIRPAWIAGVVVLVGAALVPSTALAATADLAIDKQVSAETVSEGAVFRYVVTVANAGPDAATKTEIIDRIPNSLDFVGATATQGSCSNKNRRIECNLGALGTGKAESAHIRVKANRDGQITNTARVSSAAADPESANNKSSVSVNVLPAAAPVTCAGRKATIVGTEGDDTLVGTDKRDVIVGLSGTDTIEGLRGKDIICANGGNDSIKSQGGNDVVRGGGGDDSIRTGGGNDQVRGGTGNDTITGGTGNDGLRGIGGNDSIRGKGGSDVLRGGGGADVLRGGGGSDACLGGGGKDVKRRC